MTDHEMRVKLCAAMGWTEIRAPQDGFEDWSGLIPGAPARAQLPDPLEDDADAARMRAWCVGRGWDVAMYASTHGRYPATRAPYAWSGARVSSPDRPASKMNVASRYVVGECWLRAAEEPDPCRRERTVLCRAVVQALGEEGEP